jgi:hypothetical protein
MDVTTTPTGAPVAVLDPRPTPTTAAHAAYDPGTAVTAPDAAPRSDAHHGFRPGSDGRAPSADGRFNPYESWDGNADGWIDDPQRFLAERRRHYEEVWRAHEAGVARAREEARQARLDAIAGARADAAVAPAAPVVASGPTTAADIERAAAQPEPAADPAPVEVVRAATSAYAAVAEPPVPTPDSGARYL